MKITVLGTVAFAALLLAPQAIGAAAKAPDKVGPFLKYCAMNHDGCTTSLISDEIATNLSGNSGECDIPQGIETNAGNAQILDWLKAHPETHALPVHDGLQAAMHGIWNCAEAVKTGMTSMGAPDTVGPFLAFCEDKHHYAKCANEILADNMAAYAGTQGMNDSAKGHCPSPDGITTQELAAKIMDWFRAHPEMNDQSTETAVWAAGDALWPCH
ncbi:MAG: hypothetical protein JSR55_07765 [Proteobacteria bacterium]|nr:hypothetical protein [Pseudomonadota bacterium]